MAVPVAAADGGVLKEQATFEGLGLGPFDSLARANSLRAGSIRLAQANSFRAGSGTKKPCWLASAQRPDRAFLVLTVAFSRSGIKRNRQDERYGSTEGHRMISALCCDFRCRYLAMLPSNPSSERSGKNTSNSGREVGLCLLNRAPTGAFRSSHSFSLVP